MGGGGRRGKKRGAPASSESSGGHKRGGDASGDSRRGHGSGSTSSSSGGLARGEGGPEQKKEVAALQQAGKLSVARRQSSLLDVKVVQWALKTDSLGIVRMSFAGFKSVLRRRRRLFKRVMSLEVKGTPVTQLGLVEETYHIVEITVDGRAVLQLLFRQSDGYLVAFRLVRNKQNPDAWEGWFHFSDKDIILPAFFGERKSVDWESGYLRSDEVSICRHTMSDLVACLLDFRSDNCTKKSYGDHDRVIILETWMILLGECQRSGVFLEFVQCHHNSEEPSLVGKERRDHLHSWSNFSKRILHIYLAHLMKLHGERGWEYELLQAESELSLAVSALTNFDYNLIRRFIVYRAGPEGSESEEVNGELSLPLLVGTEVGHLLHLIKCDDDHVKNIHRLMKKHHVNWPDAGTDPDSEADSEEPS